MKEKESKRTSISLFQPLQVQNFRPVTAVGFYNRRIPARNGKASKRTFIPPFQPLQVQNFRPVTALRFYNRRILAGSGKGAGQPGLTGSSCSPPRRAEPPASGIPPCVPALRSQACTIEFAGTGNQASPISAGGSAAPAPQQPGLRKPGHARRPRGWNSLCPWQPGTPERM